MTGKIKSKEEVVEGTLKVVFEVSEPFNFQPGQYMFVTLPKLIYPDERGGRRQFSIVNSPDEQGILTMTTRLSQSGFKRTLQELPVGSQVEIGPIAGSFTLPDTIKPIIFIAGGIGITPFMSMLKYVADHQTGHKITLIYSNRNQASTAYLNEISSFRSQISNFQLILTMTDDSSWQGEKRMVDAKFIKDYFPQVNDNYYMVVGPPKMVEAVEKALTQAGVTPDNIKKENFTGY